MSDQRFNLPLRRAAWTARGKRAMRQWSAAVLIVLLVCLRSAEAANHVLIFAGGDTPESNPVTFEELAAVAQQGAAYLTQKTAIDLYFAAGNDQQLDVAEHRMLEDVPEVERELWLLLARPETGPPRFRRHRLKNVAGAATLANLQAWFATRGQALKPNDQLLIAFHTHGGQSANPPTPDGSYLKLWGGERLTFAEMRRLLRQLPAGVSVSLLSTACYGGGWADLNRTEKNEDLPTLPIVGFFAAPMDRPSAGCTPAPRGDTPSDFGTCFWSAIRREWPDGTELLFSADRDNEDNSISLAEAYAFAMLADETLDLPQRTSETELRRFSRFEQPGDYNHLLPYEPGFSGLLRSTGQLEYFLLPQLARRCGLSGEHRLREARRQLRRIEFDLHALAEQRPPLARQLDSLRKDSLAHLSKPYPELAAIAKEESSEQQSERMAELVAAHGEELQRDLANDPQLVTWRKARVNLAALDAERLALEARWARFQRFIQTAEGVILAHNLRQIETPDLVKEFVAKVRQLEFQDW